MLAKAVLPVSVRPVVIKFSLEPWLRIPSLTAWDERPGGWGWHRGRWELFRSADPPYATEMNEGPVSLSAGVSASRWL